MKTFAQCISVLFCLLCSTHILQAQQARIGMKLFGKGSAQIVDIAHCNDERLFLVLKNGSIQIMNPDGTIRTTFINIQNRVRYQENERGLLGLAFHPQYKENGFFFVNYTNLQGNTHISRFKVDPLDSNKALPLSEDTLLVINQPYANHNGGCIKFGPDGYLYIGMGDGGSGGDPKNNAQALKSLLGKMLRIDVDKREGAKKYAIPADNPFSDNDTYNPEIWALGLRNPWRFSFDRKTHDLWIGDVGQDKWEEIDFQPASSKGGENYGWSCYEGTATYSPSRCATVNVHTPPVYVYEHKQPFGESVNGGFVYRGWRYPAMEGLYIFGDYEYGTFFSTKKEATDFVTSRLTIAGTKANSYTTFGEDADGELYFADAGTGNVFSVIDSTCLALTATISVQDTVVAKNAAPLQISVSPEGGTLSGRGISGTSFNPAAADTGTHFIVYKYNSGEGCGVKAVKRIQVIAPTVSVWDTQEKYGILLYPNPAGEMLYVDSQIPQAAEIICATGHLLQNITLASGRNAFSLPSLANGIYWLKTSTVSIPFLLNR